MSARYSLASGAYFFRISRPLPMYSTTLPNASKTPFAILPTSAIEDIDSFVYFAIFWK